MTKEPVGGEMEAVYASMGISRDVYRYGERTLERLKGRFDAIDRMAEYNQLKVVKAMQDCRVSEACLLGTTRTQVTEHLNRLKGQHLIVTRRGHIRILDADGLKKIAEH